MFDARPDRAAADRRIVGTLADPRKARKAPTALGIPAGTSEFTIGFYPASNGYLMPSVACSGGSTNADASVSFQAMADYNKTGLKGVYPFAGLNAKDEAQAINAMEYAFHSGRTRQTISIVQLPVALIHQWKQF
jgi:hypothetical protein